MLNKEPKGKGLEGAALQGVLAFTSSSVERGSELHGPHQAVVRAERKWAQRDSCSSEHLCTEDRRCKLPALLTVRWRQTAFGPLEGAGGQNTAAPDSRRLKEKGPRDAQLGAIISRPSTRHELGPQRGHGPRRVLWSGDTESFRGCHRSIVVRLLAHCPASTSSTNPESRKVCSSGFTWKIIDFINNNTSYYGLYDTWQSEWTATMAQRSGKGPAGLLL